MYSRQEMNTKTTKIETVEEKVTYLKAMIDEMREDGCHNVADMFAEELQTVLAMAKFDKGELA